MHSPSSVYDLLKLIGALPIYLFPNNSSLIDGVRIFFVREAILKEAKAQPLRTKTSAQLSFGMNKKY